MCLPLLLSFGCAGRRLPAHPARNVGLYLLHGDSQCRRELAVEQLFRLLHVPLIHHAQAPLLGLRLAAFGLDGHHQLDQVPAVMALHRRAVMLGQGLQRRGMAGLRLDGGDQVDQFLRFL